MRLIVLREPNGDFPSVMDHDDGDMVVFDSIEAIRKTRNDIQATEQWVVVDLDAAIESSVKTFPE